MADSTMIQYGQWLEEIETFLLLVKDGKLTGLDAEIEARRLFNWRQRIMRKTAGSPNR